MTGKIERAVRRSLREFMGAVMAALLALPAAALDLADQPLFAAQNVPGNLLLALSVEWPTASTPAYLSTTPYDPAKAYIGYFDAEKCYAYVYDRTTASASYFDPYGKAIAHACTSLAATPLWSGNYLNWATTQTLDAFRWTLTGGPRVVDTATSTIVEKTLHAGNGPHSVYPDKLLPSSVIGATPFGSAPVASRVYGLGSAVYFYGPDALECAFETKLDPSGIVLQSTMSCRTGGVSAKCLVGGNAVPGAGTCNLPLPASSSPATDRQVACTAKAGTAANTFDYSCVASNGIAATCSTIAVPMLNGATDGSCGSGAPVDYDKQSAIAGTAVGSSYYKVYVRVRLCAKSSSVDPEPNCVAYGINYKPEGLIQRYAQLLRFAAFGYLNDSDGKRDGGVMRARMKSVGPLIPVPGSLPVVNPNREWEATTGILIANSDPVDAAATTAAATAAGYPVSVVNSGVINYLNNFGRVVPGLYKTYDPVSELFYASLRYYRHVGDVPEYSHLTGAGSAAALSRWIDGFPVITNWDDPIAYACQKNYILGIGDVNTHKDADLYGSNIKTFEPATPAKVASDGYVDVETATNMVGQLEGIANLGRYSSGQNNSYFIAGLAYDAHTRDLRSDLAGSQTVDTYWMDVMESQIYLPKNQYWLATKYGGFQIPAGFVPYDPGNGTATLPEKTWHNTADFDATQKRPDNYFRAPAPERMFEGLTATFEKIDRDVTTVTSSAFAVPTPVLLAVGSRSYAASFDPRDWSGSLKGGLVSLADPTLPITTTAWDARDLLDALGPANRRIITCCTSSGGALPFQVTNLMTTTLLGKRTDYASFAKVPGVDAAGQSAPNFLAYLRGDRTMELQNGGNYRSRNHLLGDISGSKVTAVGPPSRPYLEAANPGYDKFRRQYVARPTVIYAGANDGMVHAFDGTVPDVAASACAPCGKELFAFVPSFAYAGSSTAAASGLATLGNASYVHHDLVDATPKPFDIDLSNAGGIVDKTADWRTLLIGGLGKGGRGYYALDVTDPASWSTEAEVAKKLLWEFTDDDMGYSYGDPLMVKTKKYGWVAVLLSGYGNTDGKGYFFIVNPRDGSLLQKIATPEGTATAPLEMAWGASFSPDETDWTADSVYAGDLLGNLWRLDLTSLGDSYPAPVKIALARDPDGKPQPISTAASVAVSGTSSKRYVMFGTGRLLATSDTSSAQVQTFYAIVDGDKKAGGFSIAPPSPAKFPITRAQLNADTNLLDGIGATPSSSLGWYFDIDKLRSGNAGERVIVPPIASNGSVTVGFNLPVGSACSPAGASDVLVLGFDNGKSLLVDVDGKPIASAYNALAAIVDIGVGISEGQVRPAAGYSDGRYRRLAVLPPSPRAFKRLNWREVPTAN